MTTPLSPLQIVIAAALLLATLGVAVVVLLRLRDHWQERRLCVEADTNPLLANLLDRLESRPSMRVRRSLARRTVLEDAARIQRWIEKSGGLDETGVPREPFPDTRLLERYLLQVRRGSDDLPRAIAAGLLGWTARPEIVAPLLATAEFATGRSALLRSMAMDALAMLRHPGALAELVDALETPEKDMGDAIIRALVQTGPAAVAPAAAVLADRHRPAALRRRCARLLGGIVHPEAAAPLRTALTDPNAEVRAQAAESLAVLGDTESIADLFELILNDPVLLVRAAVARALSALAPDRALRVLGRELSDPHPATRARVVEALEQLGPSARELLIVTMADPDPAVARAGARALQGIGAIADAMDQLQEHGYDPDLSEFLISVGRTGHLQPLLDALDGSRPALVPMLVRILARVGDPAAGAPLAVLLDQTTSEAVRARIVEALRRVGDGDHTGRIEKLLGARDEWVRRAAVDYLARFGDPTVTDRVLVLLEDSNPWTRASVLRVLEHFAPHGIDVAAVQNSLADPYDFVRAQAVQTLCAARAFDQLLEADVMDHIADARVRGALLAGLGEHATPVAMPLITRLAAFCADSDLDLLRHAARRAVQSLETAEVDMLMLGQADPDQESSARWFAAIAWPGASDGCAVSWRDELLSDPDPRVRAAMVAALPEREEDRAELIVAVHRALEDPAPTVVRSALLATARLGLHELESAASDALDHEDESVRVDAIFVQALLPGGAARVDSIARPGHTRAQRVAATASRLLLNDPAAVLDWIDHLRLGSDRRVIEQWIRNEHALFRHVRELAADDGERVSAAVLLCRSAFRAEELLSSVLATHPRDAERTLALRALVDAGRDRCLVPIRTALYRDPSPEIRADALAHLVERNPSGHRSDYLRDALASDEEALRIRAIRLCSLLPGRTAAELLAGALGRGSTAERAAVVERLAVLLEDRGEEILDWILHPRRDTDALADLARVLDSCTLPVCVDVLESLFAHDDPSVRATAVGPLFRRLGRGGAALLERAMDDPAGKVRAHAVRALTTAARDGLVIDDEQACAILRTAHSDPDPEVRSRTALAVARLHIDGTAGILGTLEHDEDPRVERIAREARKEYDASRREDPVA